MFIELLSLTLYCNVSFLQHRPSKMIDNVLTLYRELFWTKWHNVLFATPHFNHSVQTYQNPKIPWNKSALLGLKCQQEAVMICVVCEEPWLWLSLETAPHSSALTLLLLLFLKRFRWGSFGFISVLGLALFCSASLVVLEGIWSWSS